LQDGSVTQTSGGPLTTTTPYNVSGTNVGEDYLNLEQLFGSSAPITAGVGEVDLLAKSGTMTPSAGDYSETLTAVAAGAF
jgi:hypothetical protein